MGTVSLASSRVRYSAFSSSRPIFLMNGKSLAIVPFDSSRFMAVAGGWKV